MYIPQEADGSYFKEEVRCRSLTHDDGKLYVVDQGRDCVYCLYNYEGEESGAVFGDSGNKVTYIVKPLIVLCKWN